MANALLATLILLPVAMTFFLKSSAALGFLSLCGGFAVIALSGSDIEHLVGQTKITSLTSDDIDLALLLVPTLLTFLLTFRSVSSGSQTLLQLIPALCAGGLLAIVAAPMFNAALNVNITASPFWKNLQNAETYVVGIGLLASLMLIWGGSFSHAKAHSKKHK
ncbi:MAG TPA: hypothetical protein VFJ84_00580 [Candidatus Saccharimonadales bacterium]|nr:hypothetical protein [Candidatus Saccharimonadales bacterium]